MIRMMLAAALALLASAVTAAQDVPFALEALISEALQNNPAIKAAEQRWEQAKAAVSQQRALPDPSINLGYRDMDERETMYGVSQEIPFPGKLRLRGEMSAREAERAEQEYVAARLNVIARLKEAYYDLHLAHKSTEVLDKNRRLLVDFEATAKVRYGVGQGAQADVFRAQAEVSRVLAKLATFRQEQRSLRANLSRLLNRPAGELTGMPGEIRLTPVKRPLAELLARLAQAAPVLRAQSKGVERGDRAVALARREYYPDLEVGVQGLHSRPMGTDGYQVMLNVKVPLYFAIKQSAGVREAVAIREEAADELQAVTQELNARVNDEVAQIERAEQLVKLLDGAIIPQARATLASAKAGYAVGRVDFLTLLNSLLTLQDNELELHAEIVEHEKAVARLEEILGEAP